MNLVDRRQFLGLLGAAASGAQSRIPPNIVLVLADDLGYGDLGCYGQKLFATPHIDRLAAEGTRFTQAYAGAAVCAPSRCCLMTGKHTGHARIRNNRGRGGRISLRAEDVTVASVLKKAGYRTGIVGKWGLGEAGTQGIPNDQGFDEFFGFLNQDHALHYYPTHLWNNRSEWFPPGNQGAKRNDYAQDLFTERALRFIRENRKSPFFLYLPYTLPHADSELGRDTGDGFVVPDYEPYTDRDWPRAEKGFAAMLHRLDRDVGRLAEELVRLQLDSNTLIIFTSDNGPALDGGHTPEFFNSSGPFRGRKGQFYEGGIRVPFIARWPGRVPAGHASEDIVTFWDFLPTVASMAGVQPPKGLDGKSVLPSLLGETVPRTDSLYWEAPSRAGLAQAARHSQWKAVRHSRGSALELYDLLHDPGERTNVAAGHPEIVGLLENVMHSSRVDSPDYPLEGWN